MAAASVVVIIFVFVTVAAVDTVVGVVTNAVVAVVGTAFKLTAALSALNRYLAYAPLGPYELVSGWRFGEFLRVKQNYPGSELIA